MNPQPTPYIELFDALQFIDQQGAHVEQPGLVGPDAFRFEMLDDFDVSQNKNWLVKDLLAIGEASCIFGEPGSGKSIIAAEIALAVAAGVPWLGREVAQTPVVYFAGERADLVKRRMMGLRSHWKLPPRVPFCLSTGDLDIVTDKSAAGFIDRLLRYEDEVGEGVGLVCIDTLARVVGGGGENDTADMSKAMKNVESIRARA